MTQYTTAFKARVLQRLVGPRAISAYRLSAEVGVSQVTLSRWLAAARSVPVMATPGKKWTGAQKLRVVLAMLAAGIARNASRINVCTQAVISLVVFSGYYVCIIIGEQLADRSEIPPALAMWSANIILLLLAMLTLRVARGRRTPAVRTPSATV